MKDLKATPGPWRLNPDGSISDCTSAANVVAEIDLSDDWDACGMAYANAHLIAAAPELYACVVRMRQEIIDMDREHHFDICGDLNNWEATDTEEADSALAKARGES